MPLCSESMFHLELRACVLQEIDLSNNAFSTDMYAPSSIFLFYAKRLLLSHNRLYGTLPVDGGFIIGYVS